MKLEVQKMTAQQFDDIAKRSCTIVESNEVFPYNEFIEESHKLLQGNFTDDAYKILRDNWLPLHAPPIRYCCGSGSTRAAFAMDGGKCLKVAMNDDGIKQMKVEISNFDAGEGYACFPKLYAYDKADGFSMIVDCCKAAANKDFYALYGLPCNLAIGTIYQLMSDDMSFQKARHYLSRCIDDKELALQDEYDNFGVRLKFLDSLEKFKDSKPEWVVMHDLAQFCYENDTLGIYDLESECNWGMSLRDGIECPIVIDAGLGWE